MDNKDKEILKNYLLEVISDIQLYEQYYAPVEFTPADIRTLTVSRLVALARQVRSKYNVVNALNSLKAKLIDRNSELRKKTPNALYYAKKIEKLIELFKNSSQWKTLRD